MILPEGTESEMENVPYAFTVEEIPSEARLTMQYYAYGSSNTPHNVPILICYQTKNDCYKAAKSIGTIKGIVVHSTGANNPTLKRYVDYPAKLGKNLYGNHWNQSGVDKMVHAFIGLDKYNEVKVVQTLPYSYACWGIGSGVNGSYNYSPNGHIQFEICEDQTDDEYYNNVFNVAIRYCAYLCKRFNLSKDSIVSHKEAAELGYGSNHGDPDHWLDNYGVTMDQFRLAVYNELRY